MGKQKPQRNPEITTIQITREVKKRLDQLGKKGDSLIF